VGGGGGGGGGGGARKMVLDMVLRFWCRNGNIAESIL
jgi:hypothetical protein